MADGYAHHGLVLQGGGALGAFELGVARAIYSQGCKFSPGVIAGVSIGAITAALLARPRNGDPLATLRSFWEKVTVSGLLPPFVQPYLSFFGLPNFYDFNPFWPWDTNFYSTGPLLATLKELVDVDALETKGAKPRLIFTATDVAAGQIVTFDSDVQPLSLQHILASGSLPPAFPDTVIGQRHYWDGGVFDNTPLGAVIERLDPDHAGRAVMVVNLFPNQMPLPSNMAEVSQRFLNLLFANKTASDVVLMERFNLVALAAASLAKLPADSPVRSLPGVAELIGKKYRHIPHIMEVTRTAPAGAMEGSDFSADGIGKRAEEGLQAATELLRAKRFLP